MNKKHFLLIFLVCLTFCLSLTSCDDEKEVTDLWEQIRNTAWTMEGVWNDLGDGRKYDFNHTIGFYGPNKGPFSKNNPGNNAVSPYVVTRFNFYNYAPSWGEVGTYWFDTIDNIIIDKTGHKISDAIAIERRNPENTNEIELLTRSFNISVSGDKMTISKVKWWDKWAAERLTGTYTKVSSDPNYNWKQEN